jgi:alkylhydroperoxidase family enzyme
MGPDDSPRTTAIPPIGYEELPAALAAAFRPRVERLGYLGGFFQRAAHQPAALLAFHQFTEACKAALGERPTELVALTASVRLGNDYERNQHEQLSVRRGRSRDWVVAVERLDPAAFGEVLDDRDRQAQEVVLALLRDHGHASGPVVEAYARRYGAPEAVALLLLTGRYVAHSVLVNSLELRAPVPSIFEDGTRVC